MTKGFQEWWEICFVTIEREWICQIVAWKGKLPPSIYFQCFEEDAAGWFGEEREQTKRAKSSIFGKK
jgi:hypothetical protein